jgi:Flp pilus assembly protein TadG
MHTPLRGSTERGGQIIVVFALAIVAVIAGVALVIEAGNVLAQQRVTQNAADSAATAGTLIIAEGLSGKTRTDADVYAAVAASAAANDIDTYTADYTDDTGGLIGVSVQNVAAPVPAAARGVSVHADRSVSTTFARVLSIDSLQASSDATAVAGALSGQCVADDDGCTLLPLTFPVKVFECDGGGNLLTGQWVGAPPPGHEGEGYWPIVGAEDLPSAANPSGNTGTMAILPLCKGAGTSSGAFGWLDLVSGMNLADEITGPLNVTVDLPDWYQTQPGNPNSVDDELMKYWHQPVLIPLYNQACRVDPGDATCPADKSGVDPVGNNTWYFVHTLAVFYIDQVLVQGANVSQCASAPGAPQVPVTTGAGFLGCLKGWFVNYVTAGPVVPGEDVIPGVTPIGIQLIR